MAETRIKPEASDFKLTIEAMIYSLSNSNFIVLS
jgi:hypothetical protein